MWGGGRVDGDNGSVCGVGGGGVLNLVQIVIDIEE